VKQTISLYEMTQEEIKNTWIQEDENKAVRKKCQQIISRVEKSRTSRLSKDKTKQYCIRGLEGFFHGTKHISRLNVQDIVLDEQYKQYHEQGYVNENEIAKLYRNISMENQIQAQKFAINDRKEVERCIACCC
jgi:hypothetical protein